MDGGTMPSRPRSKTKRRGRETQSQRVQFRAILHDNFKPSEHDKKARPDEAIEGTKRSRTRCLKIPMANLSVDSLYSSVGCKYGQPVRITTPLGMLTKHSLDFHMLLQRLRFERSTTFFVSKYSESDEQYRPREKTITATAVSPFRDTAAAVHDAAFHLKCKLYNRKPSFLMITSHPKHDPTALQQTIQQEFGTKIPFIGICEHPAAITEDSLVTGMHVAIFALVDSGVVGIGAVCKEDMPAPVIGFEAASISCQSAGMEVSSSRRQVPKAVAVLNTQGHEEDIISSIQTFFGTDVSIVGGNASGEELIDRDPMWIVTQELVSSNAMAVVAFWTECDVKTVSSYGFSPSATGGMVTKISEDGFMIEEIDHKPAGEVYARWSGCDAPSEEITTLMTEMSALHPLGKVCGFDHRGYEILSLVFVHQVSARGLRTANSVRLGERLILMSGTKNQLLSRVLSLTDPISREFHTRYGAVIFWCFAAYVVLSEDIVTLQRKARAAIGAPILIHLSGGEFSTFTVGSTMSGHHNEFGEGDDRCTTPSFELLSLQTGGSPNSMQRAWSERQSSTERFLPSGKTVVSSSSSRLLGRGRSRSNPAANPFRRGYTVSGIPVSPRVGIAARRITDWTDEGFVGLDRGTSAQAEEADRVSRMPFAERRLPAGCRICDDDNIEIMSAGIISDSDSDDFEARMPGSVEDSGSVVFSHYDSVDTEGEAFEEASPIETAAPVTTQFCNLSFNVVMFGASDTADLSSDTTTILFSNVQSSDAMWAADPNAMAKALQVHTQVMRDVLTAHRIIWPNMEIKREGDAFMVAFSSPADCAKFCSVAQMALLAADWPDLAHPAYASEYTAGASYCLSCDIACAPKDTGHFPDHCLSCPRSTQHRVPLFRGLRIRMGFHTGTPQLLYDTVSRKVDFLGMDVNMAARVCKAAAGGQILLSKATAELIKEADFTEVGGLLFESVGTRDLKGIGPEDLVEMRIPWLERKFPKPDEA
ncbi:Adenylate and Guanylate cyclase catalytic domain [Carpediemonas membranifera]|uniref:Adenylate and Guanylate cyclase catalytic domain n=1 Tax=Carpediemonas membranifera TaxID=201153 RepID=A0A8J6E035_9EUKA|nr:Adenylate and Guanylate cyclase catalytic domain [Carpediemonas membranifera]|eukprot:KAG9391256.1 Adenylate and Guanylate cyclase catalytic domain [Carpediemonas membranifera]